MARSNVVVVARSNNEETGAHRRGETLMADFDLNTVWSRLTHRDFLESLSATQSGGLLRLLMVATFADGEVTDEERALLIRLMDGFGFDETERDAVFNSVDYGQPIADRLSQLDATMRAQLLLELQAAAAVDGEIRPAEQDIINEVRAAIG